MNRQKKHLRIPNCRFAGKASKVSPPIDHLRSVNRDFHMILLQSCGNEILSSFGSVISMLFRDAAYRSTYWNASTIRRLAREHDQILAAVKDDDVERAIELHKKHLHYKEKLNL